MKGLVSLGLVFIAIAAACGTDSKKSSTPSPATTSTASTTSTSTGTVTGVAAAGGTLWTKNGCAACHSFTSPFGTSKTDLSLTSVSKFTSVTNGGTTTANGTMIAYASINAQGIADLMAYVKSMKK